MPDRVKTPCRPRTGSRRTGIRSRRRARSPRSPGRPCRRRRSTRAVAVRRPRPQSIRRTVEQSESALLVRDPVGDKKGITQRTIKKKRNWAVSGLTDGRLYEHGPRKGTPCGAIRIARGSRIEPRPLAPLVFVQEHGTKLGEAIGWVFESGQDDRALVDHAGQPPLASRRNFASFSGVRLNFANSSGDSESRNPFWESRNASGVLGARSAMNRSRFRFFAPASWRREVGALEVGARKVGASRGRRPRGRRP